MVLALRCGLARLPDQATVGGSTGRSMVRIADRTAAEPAHAGRSVGLVPSLVRLADRLDGDVRA